MAFSIGLIIPSFLHTDYQEITNAAILDKILLLKQLHKVIKKKLRICRPAGSFGMKLCGEPGVAFVADPFIRTIVHIDEKRFPVFCQRVVVYGIPMICLLYTSPSPRDA